MSRLSDQFQRLTNGGGGGGTCPCFAVLDCWRVAVGTLVMIAFFSSGMSTALTAEPATRLHAVAGDEVGADAVELSRLISRLDMLLDNLEVRIENIRGQAEQILDHADTATDNEGQMRFEEMYGKLATAAERLEQERDRLRLKRDELAAIAGGG